LPEPTLRREVQGRTLVAVPLVGCRLTRPLGIIHRRRQRLSNAAQSFLNLLSAEGNGKPTAADARPFAAGNHAQRDAARHHRNGSQRHSRRSD
jgi:hypothetical protein